MMRLSTLWKVDRTLDDAGECSPLAEKVLEPWEHDEDTLRFSRSSANFVYRFRANGLERFLRFADSSERTRETIEAEVDLLVWLNERGASVVRPRRSKTGKLVETVATDAGVFHAVAFDRLQGTQLKTAALDQRHFQDWGAALGRLHATMSTYSGPALAIRPSWRDHLHRARSNIPKNESAVWRELDQIAVGLNELPVDREHYGLIHADFELDNLCWSDHADRPIGMLDFDDCSRHWYAADVSFALRDLFDADADLSHESVDAFVRGYRGQYPLDSKLLAALPPFSRLSRLLVYATLVRSLDLPDSADHPTWLRGLRRKFEMRTTAYAATLANLESSKSHPRPARRSLRLTRQPL